MPFVSLILIIIVVVVAVVALVSSVRVIRQMRIGVVERVGRFHKTLDPGLHLIVPIVDRVAHNIDTRETVVPFPPQGVITEDNLMVSIDSVIYFQVVDPVRAAYEAQNYIQAIEQLTQTTLRNIIGGMDLEQTLTSREEINQKLRAVLDDATGKWGIKVNRVELRSVEPPATIRDAMEKGARAERDKRASILLAEGQRQSQILSASGDRESSILRAQGERESAVLRAQADRQASMLRAEGEAQAITTVFNAIHAGQPDQALLSYQYLQMLPELAKGDSNKVWIVPSELNDALKGLGTTVGSLAKQFNATDPSQFTAPEKVDVFAEIEQQKDSDAKDSQRSVEQAIAEAQRIENAGSSSLRGRRRGDEAPQLDAAAAGASEQAALELTPLEEDADHPEAAPAAASTASAAPQQTQEVSEPPTGQPASGGESSSATPPATEEGRD
ncbi:SPFH domain-containing protein [Nigerium massiliense]|uniref:SPFH domain-containing protein n=1 Tax=Nigerium massiliense TaxID=1522317 RepID=UPI0009E1B2DD|nr:SPFH domain-containing protein [Nigerium massiliense]